MKWPSGLRTIRGPVSLFIFFFISLSLFCQTAEPAGDDLFSRVFSQSSEPLRLEIEAPLYINSLMKGSLRIITGSASETEVHRDGLLELLAPVITDEFLHEITMQTENNEFIVLKVLRNLGINGEYQSSNLSVFLNIPPQYLNISSIDFKRENLSSRRMIIEQADFNASMNLMLTQEWNSFYGLTENRHELPGSLFIWGSANYKGWILDTDYLLRYPSPDQLPSVSIIHDFQREPSRLTLGHYQVENKGFQHFGTYQGIDFRGIRDDERRRRDSTIASTEFTLTARSLVTVIINGTEIRKLDLDMGRYNLSDFPLMEGINEITLLIEDNTGQHRREDFIIPYESQILKTGEWDYNLSAGIPPWDPDYPLITGSIKYGINPFLTANANFQSDFTRELSGVGLLFPSKAGTLGLSLAQSWSPDDSLGFAMSLNYRYKPVKKNDIPHFGISAGFKSSRFQPVGSQSARSSDSLEFRGFMSWNLFNRLQINPSGAFYTSTDLKDKNGSVTLRIRHNISQSLSASLNIKGSFSSSEEPVYSAALLFHIRDRANKQSLSIGSDLDNGQEIQWSQSVGGQNQGSLSLGIKGFPFEGLARGSVYAGASLEANRFSGNMNTAFNSDDNGDYSSNVQLQMASAFVYADRHMAITKPVSDSFAIIVPRFNLLNENVAINPGADGYDAYSDSLGNPVLHDLRSYKNNPIEVVLLDPHRGIDLETGESRFIFHPGYRSGAVVYFGTQEDVYISGTLIDEEGSPLALKAGSLNRNGEETHLFFTDREGRFIIYAMKPGDYFLHLFGDNKSVLIRIPPESESDFNLGVLSLEGENNDID